MRRIVAVLVLLLLLTGCTPASSPEIGLCIHQETAYTRTYAQMIRQALEQRGCRVTLFYSRNDQNTQNRQLEELMDRGCDGLVVSPVLIASAEELVQRAKSANIPAVFISREPKAAVLEQWDRTAYVGCDPAGAGRTQAQLLLNTKNRGDINGDGILTYIVLQGQVESLDARDRTDYALRELWNEGLITDELHLYCTDGQTQTVQRACRKALKDYGDRIEAVLCNTDAMALTALEILQEQGRMVGRDVYLLGMDARPRALDQVQAGNLTGTVLEDYQTQARQVADTLLQLIAGQPAQQRSYVPHIPVNRKNAAKYTPWWQ